MTDVTTFCAAMSGETADRLGEFSGQLTKT
jgi:hypothetical protein